MEMSERAGAFVVTAAGGGIGGALVRRLVARGRAVFACDISGRRLQALADSLPESDERLETMKVDVGDPDAAEAAATAAASRFGRIVGLANVAGGIVAFGEDLIDRTIERTAVEELEQSYRLNLQTAFVMTKAMTPIFEAQGYGKVVNVASLAAFGNFDMMGNPAYDAAKSAVIGATRTLSRSLGPRGIRVNAVAPGSVLTDRVRESVESAPMTLSHIRVVEFTHMVAGPAAGQVLADLGATVVKVEPRNGDITRRFGPKAANASALFETTNRNKKSVRLDIRDPDEAALACDLAKAADILICNIGEEALQAAGIGYDALAPTNPGLIWIDVSAFGPGGALGTDGIAQAAMGLMSVTGPPAGEGFRTGASVVDVSTGVWAALGALAALENRRRTQCGDRLSVSLADACLYMQYSQIGMFAADPSSIFRNGNHSMVSCTPMFEASDGRIMATILHDRHWRLICELLGREDLIDDDAFESNDKRCRRQADIETVLNPNFREKPRAHWVERLRARRIPCGPERSYDEVLADRALWDSGSLFRLPDREDGAVMDAARFGLTDDELAARAAAEATVAAVEAEATPGAPYGRDVLLGLYRRLAPLGYLNSTLPDPKSGRAQSIMRFAALVEGVAPTTPLLGNHSVQRYLQGFADEAQQACYLPPLLAGDSIAAIAISEPGVGSDLKAIATSARRVRGGYLVTGVKHWVTHGASADLFVVLASTENGPTRFLIESNADGMSVEEMEPRGLRRLTFARLSFTDCFVPDEGRLGQEGAGLEGAKAAFPIARLLAGLQAVRLGEAAVEHALQFAAQYSVVGRRLIEADSILDGAAAYRARGEAARLLCYQGLSALEASDAVGLASAAKANASDWALEACAWSRSVLGAAALERPHPINRVSDDLEMMAVVDGTAALNRLVAGRRIKTLFQSDPPSFGARTH
eukprot:g319.t1